MAKTITIDVPEIKRAEIIVDIEGITPLISNRLSEEAMTEMRNKMLGIPKTKKKAPISIEESCWSKVYWIDKEKEIHGFPASAFKRSMVNVTVHYVKAISKVLYNSAWFQGQHLIGVDDLCELKFSRVWCREDVISVNSTSQNKAKGLAHRPCYEDWECSFKVGFIQDIIDPNHLIKLIDAAGSMVGVGNWRMERGGHYGQYRVKR